MIERWPNRHAWVIRELRPSEALLAAAKLSHRYIPDRFLPDKAIDLVDEACAKLKNEITSKPTILDEIDRRVIQLEMERLSLKSDYESDEKGSKDNIATKEEAARLEKLDSELERLRKQSEDLSLKWMAEKGGVTRIKDLKEQIAGVKLEIEKAERDFDLNKAAEMKYAALPALEEELTKIENLNQRAESENEAKMLRDEVIADDIADVVAVWTGIPPQKLLETERDRILSMGDKIKERLIGQDQAVQVVTDAIQRSRAGLLCARSPLCR